MKSDLIREARERYAAGIEADRLNRQRDEDDRKFYTGGDNQWMVDGHNIAEQRRADGRPAASYNRLPQFVKQVSGELRQNKPAIKVLPVDGQTDPQMAEVYSAIIRHIEGQSNGHRIYSKTAEQAVIGGQGWWRIKADYCDDYGFEQELLIERIPNPNAVVCDPAAKEPTRRDMGWAFVTEMVPKADFLKQYPKITAADFDHDEVRDWTKGEFVRIAEYWRKRETGSEKLYLLRGPGGEESKTATEVRADMAELGIPADAKIEEALKALNIEIVSQRTVKKMVIESILLCGAGELGDWRAWPGKFIPLVRVAGEEVEAGDTVFRHGMIHHAKAPQMGYNYARCAMMERHGQSTRAPYLVTAPMIQNYKTMWENSNTKNYAALVFDPDPKFPQGPQRTQPPQLDAAAYQESQIASEDMKATTGIYDAALGAQSNETSGVAIARRDAQGDTATYVYIDNTEDAIETTGIMLVDLVPHYYTESRVIRLLGEDGEVEKFEEINKILPDGKKWNDVTRGKYDVVVNTGPAYATRRQEAADKLMKLSENPQIAALGGDILVRSLDVPLGDKLADRLEMGLPPGIDEAVDKKRAEREAEGRGPPQQPPPPEVLAKQAELEMQQVKMQMDSEAGQQKLALQQQEAAARIALAQQEQQAKLQLAREQFEFDKQMAREKADLDRELAEHGAQLKEASQAHSAHLAEEKNKQQPKAAAK